MKSGKQQDSRITAGARGCECPDGGELGAAITLLCLQHPQNPVLPINVGRNEYTGCVKKAPCVRALIIESAGNIVKALFTLIPRFALRFVSETFLFGFPVWQV